MIYASALRRAAAGVIARNRLGQSRLWRFAVSGDLPDRPRPDRTSSTTSSLVEQALQVSHVLAHEGLIADLVIWNEDYSGYRATLHDRIVSVLGGDARRRSSWTSPAGSS